MQISFSRTCDLSHKFPDQNTTSRPPLPQARALHLLLVHQVNSSVGEHSHFGESRINASLVHEIVLKNSPTISQSPCNKNHRSQPVFTWLLMDHPYWRLGSNSFWSQWGANNSDSSAEYKPLEPGPAAPQSWANNLSTANSPHPTASVYGTSNPQSSGGTSVRSIDDAIALFSDGPAQPTNEQLVWHFANNGAAAAAHGEPFRTKPQPKPGVTCTQCSLSKVTDHAIFTLD